MSTRRKYRMALIMLAIIGVFAAGLTEVRGQNIDWTGGEGHWLVPGNWNLDQVPATGNTVRIESGGHVLLDDDPPVGGESWPVGNEITIGRLWMRGGGTNTLTFDASGTVHVTGGSIDFIGQGSGTDSTFNMVNGTWNSDGTLHVGHGGTGTLNVYGGEMHVNNHINIGRNSGTGTVNMYGGLLNMPGNHSLNIGHDGGVAGTLNAFGGTVNVGWNFSIGAGQAPGTLNIYSGATVNPRSGRPFSIGGDQAGTFRAWLDGSEFNTVTASGGGGHLNLGANAHLDVAFPGGLMLSPTDEYDLISYGGNLSGSASWNTEPGDLWDTTTGAGAVSVKLSESHQRGTLKLDAAEIGSQSWLGGEENDRVQYVDGHVDVENLEGGTGNLIQLALAFANDPSNYTDEDGVDFVTSLQLAGYVVWGQGGDQRSLPLDLINGYGAADLGRLVGVDVWVTMGAEDTDGHFAWDTARYTNGSSLQLESITVIPEPSTLALLGLAGLLLMKRRRV